MDSCSWVLEQLVDVLVYEFAATIELASVAKVISNLIAELEL